MTNSDFLTKGYPETPHPAWGHPLYNLGAHLFNAISDVQRLDWHFPFSARQEAARKATTVAVHYVHEAYRHCVGAIVDLPAPVRESSDYQRGYNAAQNDAIRAVDALQARYTNDLKPTQDMAIPEPPDQGS